MKRILLICCLLFSGLAFAEKLPPASQVLAFARAQLPTTPVHMTGTLKKYAANGFITPYSVEMDLAWGATPSTATYRISDENNKNVQTLKIKWLPEGPVFQCLENGVPVESFDPNTDIEDLGVTWDELSFSFLWSTDAQTLRTAKKFAKECYVLSVPRPKEHSLLLWVEKKTGRLLGAEEKGADGKRKKIMKVVSVKEFDGLWMVKDLDIIRFPQENKTSLRISTVETRP